MIKTDSFGMLALLFFVGATILFVAHVVVNPFTPVPFIVVASFALSGLFFYFYKWARKSDEALVETADRFNKAKVKAEEKHKEGRSHFNKTLNEHIEKHKTESLASGNEIIKLNKEIKDQKQKLSHAELYSGNPYDSLHRTYNSITMELHNKRVTELEGQLTEERDKCLAIKNEMKVLKFELSEYPKLKSIRERTACLTCGTGQEPRFSPEHIGDKRVVEVICRRCEAYELWLPMGDA